MRPLLLVAQDGARGAYRTISHALRAAQEGAIITVAAGHYEDALVISRVVTISAEDGPGTVSVQAAAGSVLVIDGGAAQLSNMDLIGDDPELPALDVRRGEIALDGCVVTASAWTAVLVRGTGALATRQCRVVNSRRRRHRRDVPDGQFDRGDGHQ